ncbi:hypothetical protein [Flavihumibacter fluvii]|uniref:hypothetical protein n=1 Tax=Flavihumibacter fluvii TaxID=2838157 RepID=UPI001BDDD1DC|nr:hypothetical protein [Flavihumibacter fluvii]ULQ51794.1 hypothetical protein KJS93_17030 [Flavihumibacter fluvii]
MQNSPHSFHIPVMGLAYTIDSPIKVARFGISSVISIIEDRLIEMMRKHYYPTINKEYQPMTDHIYGRVNLVTNATRPHMFIAELQLYLNYLKSLFKEDLLMGQLSKKQKFYTTFFQNLREGIQYYRSLRHKAAAFGENFGKALETAAAELDMLNKDINKSI